MFDATKGNAASEARIETMSDSFAADVMDFLTDTSISRHDKELLLERLSAVVADREEAKDFARNSSGQPAQQLGSGKSQTPTDEETRQALGVILASSMPNGFKQLLRRGYDQTTPDHIKVEDDGTPSELKDARAEVTKVTKERDNAKQELKDEQDPKNTGSLAHKLDQEKSKAGTSLSADLVEKAKVKTELDKLAPELMKLKNPSGGLLGKSGDPKLKAQNALSAAASLVKS